MKIKVLIIGSGGREHCLVWKIKQSPLVDKIYCAPGNGGTAQIAENVDIKALDIDALLDFAVREGIYLTVVGPEAPLAAGIVDRFEDAGLRIFGPRQDLARLEASKVFAKNIMKEFNIPTADFEVFDDAAAARDYIKNRKVPLVIKADGLAAGKGVVVAKSYKEAYDAIDLIMVEKRFGSAGDKVIIEECLQGDEASMLALTDGKYIISLVSAQDHKPVFDGNRGPNTGGMGAYSPASVVDEDVFNKIKTQVFNPLIKGLRGKGKVYRGVLYAGLMIKDGEPYVLEFNVRFGDPETQVILPKLNNDLAAVMLAVVDNKLENISLSWDGRYCLCVVLTSGGYPGNYKKGRVITGIDKAGTLKDIFVFHAGTRIAAGFGPQTDSLVTAGGRVLNIAGLASTMEEAREKVYSAIEKISFEDMHYRRDIGSKTLKFSPSDVK